MTCRHTALLLSLALLTASCGAAGDVAGDVSSAVGDAVDDVTSAVDDAASGMPVAPTTDGPATTPPAGGPTEAEPTGGEPADGDDDASPSTTTPVDDGGGVGANGRAILRGDRPRLVVEVDVQAGASVPQGALEHLAATASSVSDKAEITFAGGNEFASDDESWTAADLAAAAAANRSTASDDQQVSLHLLVVRGVHESGGQETNAIGLAYSASTIAYFPERVGGLAGLTGSGEGIARAVLVHELGHVLGLVNLTYTSPVDHEDPEHPGHSSSKQSVMYHAVETTLVGELFGSGPPEAFDEADRADLEGLRTGELG